MSEAKPYSKAQQLARGERRYRRKVASPKQWQAIIAAKGSRCRLQIGDDGCVGDWVHYHHVIPSGNGGDDTADNIVPLCDVHHSMLHDRIQLVVFELLSDLSDAEYAYAVGKAGEDWAERIYGLRYERV